MLILVVTVPEEGVTSPFTALRLPTSCVSGGVLITLTRPYYSFGSSHVSSSSFFSSDVKFIPPVPIRENTSFDLGLFSFTP